MRKCANITFCYRPRDIATRNANMNYSRSESRRWTSCELQRMELGVIKGERYARSTVRYPIGEMYICLYGIQEIRNSFILHTNMLLHKPSSNNWTYPHYNPKRYRPYIKIQCSSCNPPRCYANAAPIIWVVGLFRLHKDFRSHSTQYSNLTQ